MLCLALELECITKEQYQKYYGLSVEISKLLSGFIKLMTFDLRLYDFVDF
jgi:hypothetical protein